VADESGQSTIVPGMVLDGKYRVDEIVGQGGMGAVYAVTHVELGRKAAIKTLLPKFLSDETVAKRFRQEAQMAASIGHDNICEVVDISTTEDGMTYMVMPLLHGQTYADMLEDRNLSLETIVDIMAQTLAGLSAAHGENIVHRDLKPHNIFITTVGDRENFAKLLDFGISKILDQDVVTKLTQTGTMLGTPVYMSPEQARGDDTIDYRVDIYSMGIILYESLTGTCPYSGQSYNNVIYKILCGDFTPPTQINPTIPQEIEDVVVKAISPRKDDRYAGAAEMRQALVDALSSAKGHAYQPPPVYDPDMSFSPENGVSRTILRASNAPDKSISKFTPFESVATHIRAPQKSHKWLIAALSLIVVIFGGLVFVLLQNTPKATPVLAPVQAPVAVPVPAPVVEPTPEATPEPLQEIKHQEAEPATVVLSEDKKEEQDTDKEVEITKDEPAKKKTKKSHRRKTTKKKQDSVKGRFDTKFTPEY